jgi:hypothetical protein
VWRPAEVVGLFLQMSTVWLDSAPRVWLATEIVKPHFGKVIFSWGLRHALKCIRARISIATRGRRVLVFYWEFRFGTVVEVLKVLFVCIVVRYERKVNSDARSVSWISIVDGSLAGILLSTI